MISFQDLLELQQIQSDWDHGRSARVCMCVCVRERERERERER